MELSCEFEEAYANGDIQQGFLLIKDDKIRYEYLNQELFTLLYVNKKLFLINNFSPDKVQLLENHNNLLPSI